MDFSKVGKLYDERLDAISNKKIVEKAIEVEKPVKDLEPSTDTEPNISED